MNSKIVQSYREACTALFGLSAVSVGFLLVRMILSGSTRYWFLSWNLLLAWAPIVFGIILAGSLMKNKWGTWQPVGLTLLWLIFLPNSFYLITDLLHTYNSGEVSELFDIVLFGSFAVTGLMLGFFGLLIVHKELDKRLSLRHTRILILSAILLSSFAIYMGRYLRWNSWDVVINPAGVLIDFTERIVSPADYPATFATTLTFFIFIGSFYFGFLALVKALREIVK